MRIVRIVAGNGLLDIPALELKNSLLIPAAAIRRVFVPGNLSKQLVQGWPDRCQPIAFSALNNKARAFVKQHRKSLETYRLLPHSLFFPLDSLLYFAFRLQSLSASRVAEALANDSNSLFLITPLP